MENHQQVNHLNMVHFHSYVTLPEGNGDAMGDIIIWQKSNKLQWYLGVLEKGSYPNIANSTMTDADPPILETNPFILLGNDGRLVAGSTSWGITNLAAESELRHRKTMGQLSMCRRDGRFRFFVGRMYPWPLSAIVDCSFKEWLGCSHHWFPPIIFYWSGGQ